MKKNAVSGIARALLVLGLCSASIHAQDAAPPAPGKAVETPKGTGGGATSKDNNDWTGDQVQIKGKLTGLKSAFTSVSTSYIPSPYTRFYVSNE